MPIKVGKLVVSNTEITENNVEKIESNETRNTRFQLLEKTNKVENDTDGDAYIVVNGVKRKIGRKSHYLLDMLTL